MCASNLQINPENQESQRTLTPLDVALACARREIFIYPFHTCTDGRCSCRKGRNCAVKGRHPRIRGGINKATFREAQIREWWTQYPDSDIGIITGMCAEVVALEIHSEEYLRRAEDRFGTIHSQFSFPNGSGGRYLLFKHPKWRIENSVHNLLHLSVLSLGDWIVLKASDAGPLLTEAPFPKFPESAMDLVDYGLPSRETEVLGQLASIPLIDELPVRVEYAPVPLSTYSVRELAVEFEHRDPQVDKLFGYATYLFLEGFSWKEIEVALLREKKCGCQECKELVKMIVNAHAFSTPDVYV